MAVTESKVTAGAAGAGGAVITANFILYLVAVVTKHPVDTSVAMFVNSVVAYAASYVAGWLAPHTARPDLTPDEPVVTPAPVVVEDSTTPDLPPVPDVNETEQLPTLPL